MTDALPAIFGIFILIMFIAGLITGSMAIWVIGFAIVFLGVVGIFLSGIIVDIFDL